MLRISTRFPGALRRAGLDPDAVLREPAYPTPLFALGGAR